MLIERNGASPRIDATPTVAASASIIGDVQVGARCYIDYGMVIESGGPPIEIGDGAIVFAGSVIRSVGGLRRPAYAVRIGARTLVSPHSALVGCQIGQGCYVATGVIVFQGAVIGDRARIGAGAIVHAGTVIPHDSRVGMRHIAAGMEDGFVSTADIELARRAVAAANFFETAFATSEADQGRLHEEVISALLDEVHSWRDSPVT